MKGNVCIMKTSESIRTLINNYFEYLSLDDESEKDAASALKSISVVRKSDDAVYQMIGITFGMQSEEIIFKFKSLNPIMKNHDGIAGSSMEYDYCEINESDFDEEFSTYEDWEQGLLNLIIAIMNRDIFKFLQYYFIIAEHDWSFDLSCKGARMRLKFYSYDTSKCDKLVIYVEKINKACITLYGAGHDEPVTILDYDNGVTTINPVPYGTLTEADMEKLCNKVAAVMWINPINKHKEHDKR